jgi:hypothetical protein
MLEYPARREILQPGQLPAAETARKLKQYIEDRERRFPGDSRWIDHFNPHVDEHGRWQARPVLRDHPAPLTVCDARRRLDDQRRKWRDAR